MKIYIVFEDGGYCDPAKVFGAYFDWAGAEAMRDHHFGSQILAVEAGKDYHNGFGYQEVEVKLKTPDGSATPAFKDAILKAIAESSPYADLARAIPPNPSPLQDTSNPKPCLGTNQEQERS